MGKLLAHASEPESQKGSVKDATKINLSLGQKAVHLRWFLVVFDLVIFLIIRPLFIPNNIDQFMSTSLLPPYICLSWVDLSSMLNKSTESTIANKLSVAAVASLDPTCMVVGLSPDNADLWQILMTYWNTTQDIKPNFCNNKKRELVYNLKSFCLTVCQYSYCHNNTKLESMDKLIISL